MNVARGGNASAAVVLRKKKSEFSTAGVGVHDVALVDHPVCRNTICLGGLETEPIHAPYSVAFPSNKDALE